MPAATRYHSVAILLHWLTVPAILALFALGWIMVDLKAGSLQFELFQWHKSVGFTVLALVVLRLGWRAFHRPPPLPAAMAEWEKRGAHLGHLALYALMILLPLTGWALVSTSRFNIPTLLYGLIPVPHLGFLAELPDKAAAHELFEDCHEVGTWVLAAILVIHVGAALRHHFLQKDDVLRRMLPKLMLAVAVTAAALGWAAPAAAAEWLIDAGHSRLGFSGSQGGTAFTGGFARWQGGIDFDPAQPATGHASITIDMASAATGDAEKDQLLPQSEWFDIKAFPTAHFEATSFRAKGGNSYEAVGSLTIRGISRPVVLPFTLELVGDHAHVTGSLDLVRTDFGIGQGMWSNAQNVALQVAVTLDLAAQRRSK